ncbi:MAG: hypothetical protein JW891_00130 [Candidatus Lokiarchaeota archaeon]|nr:hypothetical protein [Candidatus Lokiarchaeota archaeon]
MVMRLWKKAWKMSTRDKKTFTVFALLYTFLTFTTSFMLDYVITSPDPLRSAFFYPLVIIIVASLVLTLLYAWLTVRRNRKVWATLKCIGWRSSEISWLILGYIFYTTIMGLFITVEFCLHWVAITGYIHSAFPDLITEVEPLVSLQAVGLTVAIFIAVQFVGYIAARGRITKVRPMLALKRVGE